MSGFARGEMALDRAENCGSLEHDPRVRESQHSIAEALQVRGADLVIRELRFVAVAVDFDDESASQAHEVDDVGANGVLTSERAAREAVSSKVLPKALLGGSRPAAKQSSFEDHGVHSRETVRP